MNGEELVEEVVRIVQDPAFDDDLVLRFLNRAQLFAAEKMLMPALSGGVGFITTVTDGTDVPLPADFHRELYGASINKIPVEIFANKGLAMQSHGVGPSPGPVFCCAVDRANLFYMDAPTTPVQIDLLYYRKPVKMTISSLSRPDGLNQDSEAFDTYLVAHACWKIYQEIEQGLEGRKVDTLYHKSVFDQASEDLLSTMKESRPRRQSKPVRGEW